MTWYVYRQNNSRGEWHLPAINLVVEALSQTTAFEIAKQHGLDLDAPFCPCCGERWSDHASEEAKKPTLDDMFIDPDGPLYKGRGHRGERSGAIVPRAMYVATDGTVEVVE